MDIEQQQAEVIQQFMKQARNLEGEFLASLLIESTSHPTLFAFSEILSVSNLSTLEGTQYSSSLDLLRLFAYGTWTDYKSNACQLPALLPDQVRKLKQLSVLTLAESNKVLSYDQLMQELDVSNVRELEDFLINECMYSVWMEKMGLNELLQRNAQFAAKKPWTNKGAFLRELEKMSLVLFTAAKQQTLCMESDFGQNLSTLVPIIPVQCVNVTMGIVRGKLDQLRRCFEVQFAAGRDLRPEQVTGMIETLANWLSLSDNLLHSIQDKIRWADSMSEADKKHRKEVEDKVEEVKKSLKADLDLRGHEEILFADSGGLMEYEEDRVRSKRRRQPMA